MIECGWMCNGPSSSRLWHETQSSWCFFFFSPELKQVILLPKLHQIPPVGHDGCVNTTTEASGHIFSDVPGLIRCFFSTSYTLLQVTQLGLIRSQLVSRWLAALTPWFTSLEPQPSWSSLCRFGGTADGSLLPLFPRCPTDWRLWLENGLQIPCIQPPLRETLLSTLPADSCWPDLCTWKASFQKPLLSDLPMGWSVPAAPLAWWIQTPAPCLVTGWWLQCSWGTSAAVWGPVQQLPVPCRGQDACRCSFGLFWLLPSFDKGDSLLGGSGPLGPLNSCADGFSDDLQDLTMPPTVPSLSKCLCTAAEDVLQGCSLGTQWARWCLCFAPSMQIWWASKLSPGHFPLN